MYKEKLVDSIMEHRKKIMFFNLEELVDYSKTLSEQAPKKSFDELLVDAYALVCEVAKEVVRERPDMRKTQIAAAIALHDGQIVEMQNGEGKTLAATMPAYLNCLKKQHVHIATYNNYLASRDALWMGPVYATLGLTVGVVEEGEEQYQLRRKECDDAQKQDVLYELIPCSRQSAYACDVVYGTYNDFLFDYLRDNLVAESANIVQDGHLDYIILDEADSVLIEMAHEACDLVGTTFTYRLWYWKVFDIAKQLQKSQDFNIVTAQNSTVELTPSGVARAEQLLREAELLSEDAPLYGLEAAGIAEQIVQSLHAIYITQKDRSYIVKKDKNGEDRIKVIDSYTGRSSDNRKFRRGLQQALEIKEGIPHLSPKQQIRGRISYQHFFKLYKKMAGMTATAREHSAELFAVYRKHVVEIPPFRETKRKDGVDFIYGTRAGRLKGVIEEIEERHEQGRGQPILVNTMTPEMAKEIGQLLLQRGIHCKVLDAEHEIEEAEIIENAGKPGSVTIAAKMAGRGTDIQITAEAELLQGLHVIGVERYETRYMDRQLAGRAGRQGKPGSSQFFLSLEDDLLVRLGSNMVSRAWQTAGMNDDLPLGNKWVSSLLKRTQSHIEKYNFERRRQVYERDRLLDKQRRSIYSLRLKIVMQEDISEELATLRKNVVARCMHMYIQGKKRKHWKIDEVVTYFQSLSGRFKPGDFSWLREQRAESVQVSLINALDAAYDKQSQSLNDDALWMQLERSVLLLRLDTAWMGFLARLDDLQEENALRSYVEEQQFAWYAVESFKAFQEMMVQVEESFLREIFKLYDKSTAKTVGWTLM